MPLLQWERRLVSVGVDTLVASGGWNWKEIYGDHAVKRSNWASRGSTKSIDIPFTIAVWSATLRFSVHAWCEWATPDTQCCAWWIRVLCPTILSLGMFYMYSLRDSCEIITSPSHFYMWQPAWGRGWEQGHCCHIVLYLTRSLTPENDNYFARLRAPFSLQRKTTLFS